MLDQSQAIDKKKLTMPAKTRFKELRERLGLTQSEVALRLGVTKQAVSAYETGRSKPDAAAVKDLLTEAGVSLDWLYGLDGEGAPQPLTLTITDAAGREVGRIPLSPGLSLRIE